VALVVALVALVALVVKYQAKEFLRHQLYNDILALLTDRILIKGVFTVGACAGIHLNSEGTFPGRYTKIS
jgi:hypothetical protein